MVCSPLWFLLTAAVVLWNLELLHWWGFGTSEQKVSAGFLWWYREYLYAGQNRSMSYKVPICWMKSLLDKMLTTLIPFPIHGREVGTRWFLRSFPTQIILYFYDSMISWLENYKGLPLLWVFMPCPCVSSELRQEAKPTCKTVGNPDIFTSGAVQGYSSLSLPFPWFSCVKKLQFISPLHICRNGYC